MKRIISCAIALIMLVSLSAFAEEGFTVTDQAERSVTFDKAPGKIASCYYIATASVLGLDRADMLCGIEMKADTRGLYNLAAPEILSLPAVGSGKGVNIEEIASIAPDAVILPIRLKDDATALEEIGIKTVIVDPESYDDFVECVRLIGAVTGAGEEAEAMISRCADITATVENAVSGADKPVVYLASGSDFLTTYPSGLYQNDMITIAGGVNAAGEMEDSRKVTIDPEQLLAWQPEYIFIAADADYTAEDIAADPVYAALEAVQNGRVITFPSDIEAWDYPTPSCVLGQLFMASVIHPELVSEVDFIETAKSFYSDIFGFTPEDSVITGTK